MKKIMFMLMLGAFLYPVNAIAEKVRFIGGGDFFLQRNGSHPFEPIPLFVRQIPGHRDDGYLGGRDSVPLSDQSVRYPSWTFGLRVLGGVSYHDFELRVGPALHIFNPFQGGPNAKNRAQQNQDGNSQRGDPYSLRFYEVNPHAPWSTIRFTAQLSPPAMTLGKDLIIRLIGGVELDPIGLPLEIEAGWDRFNGDRKWKEFDFGRLREHAGYVRIEIGSLKHDARGHDVQWLFVEIGRTRSSFSPRSEFMDVRREGWSQLRVAFGRGGASLR